MKKFPSFKSAVSIPKEKEEVKETKRTETAQITRRHYKEDLSFGKRLDFTETAKKDQKSIQSERQTEIIQTTTSTAEIAKRRQVEYNRQLRRNPKDVNLWIEFVKFQDEFFETEMGKGLKKRKLIERKIFIVKKAIELNPNVLELVFMHLNFVEEIEDSGTLMRAWEKYLNCFEGENYFELSKKYLEFRQKRFLAFSFDQVNAEFSTVFKRHIDAPVDVIISLYKTYFAFLKRSGYNELIISILQALIETNIEQFNYGQVDISGYEDQWDFGLMEHIGDSVVKPQEITIGEVEALGLKKWLKIERSFEKAFWHPKHFDESDEQIIFDDVKDFIIILKEKVDILHFIRTITRYISHELFKLNYYEGLLEFFIEIYRTLLPFFKKDWEFIYCHLRLLHEKNRKEVEAFANGYLRENRDSLEAFFAYGRFQEFIGNSEMARKVYESIRKRSREFANLIKEPINSSEYFDEISVIADSKEKVYELVRKNPGDKSLYMKIIEFIESTEPELAIEVFNLIDEQQLKLFTFLED